MAQAGVAASRRRRRGKRPPSLGLFPTHDPSAPQVDPHRCGRRRRRRRRPPPPAAPCWPPPTPPPPTPPSTKQSGAPTSPASPPKNNTWATTAAGTDVVSMAPALPPTKKRDGRRGHCWAGARRRWLATLLGAQDARLVKLWRRSRLGGNPRLGARPLSQRAAPPRRLGGAAPPLCPPVGRYGRPRVFHLSPSLRARVPPCVVTAWRWSRS